MNDWRPAPVPPRGTDPGDFALSEDDLAGPYGTAPSPRAGAAWPGALTPDDISRPYADPGPPGGSMPLGAPVAAPDAGPSVNGGMDLRAPGSPYGTPGGGALPPYDGPALSRNEPRGASGAFGTPGLLPSANEPARPSAAFGDVGPALSPAEPRAAGAAFGSTGPALSAAEPGQISGAFGTTGLSAGESRQASGAFGSALSAGEPVHGSGAFGAAGSALSAGEPRQGSGAFGSGGSNVNGGSGGAGAGSAYGGFAMSSNELGPVRGGAGVDVREDGVLAGEGDPRGVGTGWPEARDLGAGAGGGGEPGAFYEPGEDDPEDPRTPRKTRRQLRTRRRRKMFRIAGIVAAALLVLVGAGGTFIYLKLNGNISSFDPNASGNRPAEANANAEGKRPVNVLLMGSDTRAGKNGKVVGGGLKDSSGFGNADTAMILHISADHQHAVVLSLPRDLVIQLPSCKNAQGVTVAGHIGQINSAYAIGGPACSTRTIETLTGVRMNHTMIIDFHGFVNMIDDIGGVQVCVPKAVNDTKSHIRFQAGITTVKGDQALNYVREREGLGDGGDRSRITRQHAFISSMINKLQSSGVLLNPTRLLSLANDATSSLTVDKDLNSVTKLVGFANSIKGIKPGDIKFLTVKTENYPPTAPLYATFKQQLALVQPTASEEFTTLRTDASLNTAAPIPATSASSPVAVNGAGVRLTVLNGTGHQGLAGRVAGKLNAKGFTATTSFAPAAHRAVTTIQYGAGQAAGARKVAQLFPGAKLESVRTPGIKVILGEDASTGLGGTGTGTGAAASAKPQVPSTIATARSAATNLCQGLQAGD